jgi:hypothetical protein
MRDVERDCHYLLGSSFGLVLGRVKTKVFTARLVISVPILPEAT